MTYAICKISADETSLSSTGKKDKLFQNNLTLVFKKISLWAHQWKILFNPDPCKQGTEFYFPRKQNQNSHLPIEFNDNTVQTVEAHKHLDLSLD